MIKKILRGEFVRNVGILATGSFIAQVIILVSAPLLTRLYGPSGFAVFTLFMAFISTLSPGVSGRYEVAILTVKTNEESLRALTVSMVTAMVFCCLLFCVLLAGLDYWIKLLNAQTLGYSLLLVPLGLFFLSLVVIMRYYANSKKDYKNISFVLIGQAIVTTFFSIIFGLAKMEKSGLIISLLVGYIFGALFLFYLYKDDILKLHISSMQPYKNLAIEYKDLPLYNASTGVLNGITLSLAVFFLTKHYPPEVVGFYGLLSRVANSPLKVISQAVSQVHIKRVADLMIHKKPIKPYLVKAALLLIGVVFIPCVISLFFAPSLFALTFGQEWREAGVLLSILTPAIGIRFVVSTLSPVFASTGNNHLGALWRIFALGVGLSVYFTFSGNLETHQLFQIIMIMDIILYLIHFGLIWKAAGQPRNYKL